MTLGMVIWVVVVGGAVSTGGWALARVGRSLGRPERWIWIGALAAVVAISWVPAIPEAPTVVTEFRAVEVSAARAAWATLTDTPIPAFGALWAGITLLMICGVTLLELRERRRRRAMPTARLWGYPVRVDERGVPSVSGLLRPTLTLPPRAFRLEGGRRRALVTHELEHLRAGDVRLLAAAWLGVALAPWNPWSWILARRVAFAVEADCDRRTLLRRGTTSPHAYADLLVEVAGWRGCRTPAGIRLAMGRDARRLVARVSRLAPDAGDVRVVPPMLVLSLLLTSAVAAAPTLTDPPRVRSGPVGTLRAVEGTATYEARGIREQPRDGDAPAGVITATPTTGTATFALDSIDDGRGR